MPHIILIFCDDPGEATNVAEKHPDAVDELIKLVEKEKSALGEWTKKGAEVSETISIESPELIIK